jgi:predicted aspartyl protease
VISRRSLFTNLAVLGLVGGGLWWSKDHLFLPAPKPRFSDPAGGRWLPMVGSRDGLAVIPVGLGGRLVHALVDSGAQYSAIDRGFAERLGLESALGPPIVAMGVGGTSHVAPRIPLALDVGGVALPRVMSAALDLSTLSAAMDAETPLILGFDVLASLVADIDFSGRRLRFLPAAPAIATTPAPVRRQGRALLAEVSVEGRSIELLIDTGSGGHISLSEAAARDLGLLDRPSRPARNLVLGGVASSQIIEIGRLEFAGHSFTDVPLHVIQLPAAPGFPKGLLGAETLRRWRVIMEAGAGRLSLIEP